MVNGAKNRVWEEVLSKRSDAIQSLNHQGFFEITSQEVNRISKKYLDQIFEICQNLINVKTYQMYLWKMSLIYCQYHVKNTLWDILMSMLTFLVLRRPV